MKITCELYQLTRAVRLLIAIACLATLQVFSYAQDDKKPVAENDQKQITIEPVTVTVTVTAQKEPEPALSVPLSITAVTEEDLTNANILAVKPAAAYAPNTFINVSVHLYPPFRNRNYPA
jgi:hypothetical protein